MNKLEEELAVLCKNTFTYHDNGEFSGFREAALAELLMVQILLQQVINEKIGQVK